MLEKSYRDLIVWRKSIEVVKDVYLITESFPREEIYGLISQMRRAAVSIPSNIAEGRSRGTRKDFVQFLRVSLGSCAELSTQIIISKELPKTKDLDFTKCEQLLIEVMKMLNVIIRKLTANS